MDAARLTILIFPILIGAVGLFIAIMGATRLAIERAFLGRAINTEGTIVGYGPRRLPRRIVEYPRSRYLDYPIIEYTTREGQVARFESPGGASKQILPAGMRVAIRYDPGDPTDGRLAIGGNPSVIPITLIVIGLVLGIAAITFAAAASAFAA